MRRSIIQQIAFTLTVILLLQEFSSARYINRPLRLKGLNERLRKSALETSENALETQEHSRNRRSLGAILFGTALFVSIANIAFDVYLQIEGCCGLYPNACTYIDKFKQSQANIESLSTATDAVWANAEAKHTWVSYTNDKNSELWIQVNRIMQLSQQIVEVLDPNVVIALQEKNAELEKAVANGNQTVLLWSAAQISTEFNSLFDTQLGTLQHLSGVVGNVAELILARAYGWYKKVQIRNMLTTTYGSQLANANDKSLKFLGAVDADDLVKQTTTSRYNYNAASSRGAKIVGVATGVLSLFQIGVEIWMAILKVQQCENTRDSIRDAYNQIKPQEVNMAAVKADVDQYYSNLTSLYDTVKSQITSELFLDYLGQIKNMTDYASVQTTAMQTASNQLSSFMSGITNADESTTYDYQVDLISALSNVTFTYECYLVKARTIASVDSRCKSGSDTLQNIYNSVTSEYGTNTGSCTNAAGITYTSYASIETYIQGSAQRSGYQSDCILNNADKQGSACAKKCSGFTSAETATDMSITEVQATYFYDQCPSECPPTPAERDTICTLKGYGLPVANIAAAVNKTEDQVNTVVAKDCP